MCLLRLEILRDDEAIRDELDAPLEKGSTFAIRAPFLHRNMSGLKQAAITVPHPSVAKHGQWLLDVLEYHLL